MYRRHLIVCLAFALTGSFGGDASAGLCDWLFGRHHHSPYVAGYAPVALAPTGAPILVDSSPYAAAYPGYAAGYPSIAIAGAATAMPQVSGAYQAQMQSYDNPSVYTGRPVVMAPGFPATGNMQTSLSVPTSGFVTPMTHTMGTAPAGTVPVINRGGGGLFGRAPATVPLQSRLRGATSSSSMSFYGTGNVYPSTNTFASPGTSGMYQSGYPTAGVPMTSTGTIPLGAVPTGTPPTAYPATPVAPLFPNAPQPAVGGLGRFFGSMLGTNYQSSYYPAPITYYRPVTSVDPVSGTTVTVQQPCTSVVQQLQRTPYSTLHPSPVGPTTVAPITGAPLTSPTCQSPYPPLAGAAPVGSFPGAMPGSVAAPFPSDVGQVGGTMSPSDQMVVPIPSTQAPGYYQQPSGSFNTAPLTGASPNGDRVPVDQPRLESARPSDQGGGDQESWWRREVSSPEDADNLDLRRSEDAPSADDDRESPYGNSVEPSSILKRIDFGERSAANDAAPALSSERPIAAPEGFENPFGQRVSPPIAQADPNAKPQTNGSQSQWSQSQWSEPALTAPPLPAPQLPTLSSRDSERAPQTPHAGAVQVSVPVREATLRHFHEAPVNETPADQAPAIRVGPPAEKPPAPQRDSNWYRSQ